MRKCLHAARTRGGASLFARCACQSASVCLMACGAVEQQLMRARVVAPHLCNRPAVVAPLAPHRALVITLARRQPPRPGPRHHAGFFRYLSHDRSPFLGI